MLDPISVQSMTIVKIHKRISEFVALQLPHWLPSYGG